MSANFPKPELRSLSSSGAETPRSQSLPLSLFLTSGDPNPPFELGEARQVQELRP